MVFYSRLERFSMLKFGVLVIAFGLFRLQSIYTLFVCISQVHSSLGKLLAKRSLLPRLCLPFMTGFHVFSHQV
ncbi:hypothetical protein Hanom_Chr04g00304711 [Helianthus anomalus]